MDLNQTFQCLQWLGCPHQMATYVVNLTCMFLSYESYETCWIISVLLALASRWLELWWIENSEDYSIRLVKEESFWYKYPKLYLCFYHMINSFYTRGECGRWPPIFCLRRNPIFTQNIQTSWFCSISVIKFCLFYYLSPVVQSIISLTNL